MGVTLPAKPSCNDGNGCRRSSLQSPVFRSVVMLVCEAAFAEWTEDEQLRQTTFLGWRDDKNAELVTRNAQPVTSYHHDHPVPMNRAM